MRTVSVGRWLFGILWLCKRTAVILIRPHGCTDRYVPPLSACAIRNSFSWRAMLSSLHNTCLYKRICNLSYYVTSILNRYFWLTTLRSHHSVNIHMPVANKTFCRSDLNMYRYAWSRGKYPNRYLYSRSTANLSSTSLVDSTGSDFGTTPRDDIYIIISDCDIFFNVELFVLLV